LSDKEYNLQGTTFSSTVKCVYDTEWEGTGREGRTGSPDENQQQSVSHFTLRYFTCTVLQQLHWVV